MRFLSPLGYKMDNNLETKYGVQTKWIHHTRLGFQKNSPFEDPLAGYSVGVHEEDSFRQNDKQAPLSDILVSGHLGMLVADNDSPFQASNGNDDNAIERPMRFKSAKSARLRKRRGKIDSAGFVSESINAGFRRMMDNSHRNWVSYMKSMEEFRLKKEEEERYRDAEEREKYDEERLLSMIVKKSNIYKNRANISATLINTHRQLRAFNQSTHMTIDECEEYGQLKKLVQDLESQLEELWQVDTIDLVSPLRGHIGRGKRAATSNNAH